MKSLIISFIILASVVGCKEKKNSKPVEQFNISFYLDLSDRIEDSRNPLQAKKDAEIVKQAFDVFSKKLSKKGTFDSKDKFKVFFSPFEQSDNLIGISRNLQFDFSDLSIREKKILFSKMNSQLTNNLDSVYKYGVSKKEYIGSDIYRFFKDELQYKCIEKESNYRNILIILTDGYMYWKHSRDSVGNRFSYLTANSKYVRKLRNSANLEKMINEEDYGFVNIDKKYENLEILVLEINPIEEYPKDFDIIKGLWSKWLGEMGIKRFEIIKSTDVETVKNVIVNFIEGGK